MCTGVKVEQGSGEHGLGRIDTEHFASDGIELLLAPRSSMRLVIES